MKVPRMYLQIVEPILLVRYSSHCVVLFTYKSPHNYGVLAAIQWASWPFLKKVIASLEAMWLRNNEIAKYICQPWSTHIASRYPDLIIQPFSLTVSKHTIRPASVDILTATPTDNTATSSCIYIGRKPPTLGGGYSTKRWWKSLILPTMLWGRQKLGSWHWTTVFYHRRAILLQSAAT